MKAPARGAAYTRGGQPIPINSKGRIDMDTVAREPDGRREGVSAEVLEALLRQIPGRHRAAGQTNTERFAYRYTPRHHAHEDEWTS